MTDSEAGKLTFDSLTAVPRAFVRRVVAYHTVAWHRSPVATSSRGHTIRGVQTVAYHHRAGAPAAFSSRAASRRHRG